MKDLLIALMLMAAAAGGSPEPPKDRSASMPAPPKDIKAVYVGSNVYGVKEKIDSVVYLLKHKEINAVVVDFKDDYGKVFDGEEFERVVKPFREAGARLICRIVTMRDTKYGHPLDRVGLAVTRPELALKSRSTGGLWRDDNGHTFLNPAHPKVAEYYVSLAVKAAEKDCEPNFDYVRFPSEGKLSDILLPVPNGPETKYPYLRKAMRTFLSTVSEGIRKSDQKIFYSADLFGYAAMSGEPGIGQYVSDFAEFGFGIYPMLYPSHFRCNAFGISDPNTDPFMVYYKALVEQLRYLKKYGYTQIKVIPWVWGVSSSNNYGCGLGVDPKDPKGKRIIGIVGKPGRRMNYARDPALFRQQMRGTVYAGMEKDLKEFEVGESWIAWNSSVDYYPDNFLPKKK